MNLNKACFQGLVSITIEAFWKSYQYVSLDSYDFVLFYCRMFFSNECEVWETDGSEDEEGDTEVGKYEDGTDSLYFGRLLMIFLLSWQYKLGVSDSAVAAVLQFLHILFSLINRVIGSELLSNLLHCLPKSVPQRRSHLKISDKLFVKYVACVKCHTILKYDECVQKGIQDEVTSKQCPYVAFPSHPQRYYRKACDTPLMREVKDLQTGKSFCYPFRTYCWKSITDTP